MFGNINLFCTRNSSAAFFFLLLYYMIWISEHRSESGQTLTDGTIGDQLRRSVNEKKSLSKLEPAVWTLSILPAVLPAVEVPSCSEWKQCDA